MEKRGGDGQRVARHDRACIKLPICQQYGIRHCAEVKKWEHTVLPCGNKILCCSLFSKRSPVS